MHRHGVLQEGILVGLAGAITVALWFLVYDLAIGQPLRTPALLGAAMFEQLRDPADLVIRTDLVVKYSIVHGLVFIVFGVMVAGLFALADRDRHVLFLLFMLFCCFEVTAVVVAAITAQWLFRAIAPWSFLVGNAMAATVMLTILFRHSRRSLRELLIAGE